MASSCLSVCSGSWLGSAWHRCSTLALYRCSTLCYEVTTTVGFPSTPRLLSGVQGPSARCGVRVRGRRGRYLRCSGLPAGQLHRNEQAVGQNATPGQQSGQVCMQLCWLCDQSYSILPCSCIELAYIAFPVFVVKVTGCVAMQYSGWRPGLHAVSLLHQFQTRLPCPLLPSLAFQ